MQIQTEQMQKRQDYFGSPHHLVSQKNFARSNYSTTENRTAQIRHTEKTSISQSIETLSNASTHTLKNNYQLSSFQAALIDQDIHVQTNTEHIKERNEYNFSDVLDVINPLHHIPLVNVLYRGISGDDIKPASQIIGSAIFSGPVGAVGAVINTVIEHETGRDITGNAIALVSSGEIERIDHKNTFDYSTAFEENSRTAISTLRSTTDDNHTLYNFNKANTSYTARDDYAQRYNS